jgi:DNA invertase Pin-like site-specific DNA recombinase
LAEFEKALIRARTSEGRARAKARRVRPEPTEHHKREAIKRSDRYRDPVREIARGYNVSHSTISRLVA